MTHIVACVDGSRVTSSVAVASQWAADRCQAPLLFLHALEQPELPMAQDASGAIGLGAQEGLLSQLVELEAQRAQLALKQGQLLLEHLRAESEKAGVSSVTAMQRHGNLLEVLAEQADTAEMLVLGRQGASHESFNGVIGSHIESVIRTTQRPVLLVAEGFVPPKRFLMAFDGSATAQKALDWVCRSPLLQDVPCHLVMVGEEREGRSTLDHAAARLIGQGFEVTAITLSGNEIWRALVDYQRDAEVDLTVMGAYGHSRIRQFLVGSQTTQLLQHSVTPLLLLR